MSRAKVRGRPIDGIVLLDKPIGLSSNQALQQVKGIFFVQKAGHTGSLDPLATGMLPLCFGEATKFAQFLLDAAKHYQVVAKYGVKTTTCDSEGEVVQTRPAEHITQADLEKILPQFTGEITQVPSMFSALKHQGQPLYKLARQGIEVEREARPVTISSLTLLNFDAATQTFALDVHCSKGTYIRNLVDDMGEALGCGAHVIELRRLGVANFTADQMVTLEQLDKLRTEQAFGELDTFILPLEKIATALPTISLTESAAFKIRQGHGIDNFPSELKGLVSLQISQEFIGIGELTTDNQLLPRRLKSY
jgi:tRNA pseudouridine55 synthase